jgi:protease-4
MAEEMVAESKSWFIDLVARSRSIDPAAVPGLTDGRVYSGRQALSLKLIDQIGGEKEAVAWLEEKRQVPKDLKVIDWEPESSSSLGWLGGVAKSLLSWAGLPTTMLDTLLGSGNAWERVRLDGLVSVWHAQGN